MSDEERSDREAILKRRLLFIGSALIGLGACASGSDPPPGPCLSPPYVPPPEASVPPPDVPPGAGGGEPQTCLSIAPPTK